MEELRVLGVRAEPPEIAPGASTVLDALVVDPKGAGRPIARAWALCTPDPARGVSSCADPGRIVPLGTGTSQNVTVAPGVLAGLTAEQQAVGIDLFAVLDVRTSAVSGGAPAEEDTAFKRIRVSTSAAPNHNPAIDSFLVASSASEPAVVGSGATVKLTVMPSVGSAESYTTPAGDAVEDLRLTWLVSAGKVEDVVGVPTAGVISTSWTAAPAAPPATLWVVLRDARGGIAWMTRDVIAP